MTTGPHAPDDRLSGTGPEVWSSAAWRDGALAWLDERLPAVGRQRTGPAEQPHLRAWATVLKVPTDAGPVWFKAAGPSNAFEAGLYEVLHRVAPDRVLTPIAVDARRGWVVLPDGGESLGTRLTGPDLVEALASALSQYGQLQRALAPEVDRLLALGVADMRAAAMPGRFDEAVDRVGERIERTGTPRDQDAHLRVAALRPRYLAWCDHLAAAPGPASLDHNDLHPWNILLDGSGEADEAGGSGDAAAGVRFYDWGDAVVAHAFASMLVPLSMVETRLGVPSDVARVRDAYLDAFADLADHADLVDTLELACRVGKVARALTWDRALRALGGDDPEGFAEAPQSSLHSLLDDSYLGGA
jgi:Phosphotransferase enzyme family